MTAAQEHRHFKHLPACPLCKERIADLEAERKKLRGWLTATEKALTESQIRAEKAEAELASVRDGLPESVKRGKWVVY